MDFVGLTRSDAATTFAVVGLCVTVLYLLRLRRVRREVAYIGLWQSVLSEAKSSQLFARLRRWGSWLLALAIVLLVTLALADPRRAAGERTLHVLVLDTSMSMQATDVAPSRFLAARERADALLDRLPEGDVAVLVTMGARPSAGPVTDDLRELHAALARAQPTETRGDLGAALDLAADIAHLERNVRVVLFTDGAVTIDAERRARLSDAELFSLALPAPSAPIANYAVTALAARPHPLDPSRAEVLLELESFADEEAELEVVLTTEGRAVEVVRLPLAPRERVRRFFTDVSGLDRTLEASLRVVSGLPDALPADDRAYARIARRTRARVGVVSADNAYLEAALLLDEALEVTELTADAIDPLRQDVVIFDGVLPAEPYPGAALYLHPDARASGASPLEATGEVERPRFDVLSAEHPLLRWVSLRNVNIGRALVLRPEASDVVVAGDEGVPLLIAGERDAGGRIARFVALAFDVEDSDLPLRIAWPVLLLDAIHFLGPDAASEPAFARAGMAFEEAVPNDAEVELTLAGTEAARAVAVRDGRARLEIDRAGVHRLTFGDEELLVAVSPTVEGESNLGPAHAVEVDGAPLGPLELPARAGARLPWEWLALIALGLLLAESLSYHRRWTV